MREEGTNDESTKGLLLLQVSALHGWWQMNMREKDCLLLADECPA